MKNAYLEDLAAGQQFQSGRVKVEEAEVIRFGSEYDPQIFHLDPELAKRTIFAGLAASGWHTAALTMRLIVDGDLTPAGGFIGAGIEELVWPVPVRPGDELHVQSEILALRRSKTRPTQGVVKVRNLTFNQKGEVVQRTVINLIVQARTPGP